jgi:hypothetical protein
MRSAVAPTAVAPAASSSRSAILASAAGCPLLGYWREVLEKPSEELREQRTRELTALRESGTAYHHVSRAPVNPGYEAWLRGILPEAGITVLPGSGHFPHVAQTEVPVQIISGWE